MTRKASHQAIPHTDAAMASSRISHDGMDHAKQQGLSAGHAEPRGLGIQPKLEIGATNDAFEQEADHVADQITTAQPLRPASDVSTQRATPGLLQRQEDDEEAVQMKADAGPRSQPSANFSHRLASQAGQGRALDSSTRQEFEGHFNRDLGDVRIHTNTQANQLSRDIHARAFTHRNHVYFNAGQYAPTTHQGRWLLAHELTHTIQQKPGNRTSSMPAIEREADTAASLMAKGQKPTLKEALPAERIAKFGQPQALPEQTFIANPSGDSFLTSANDYHNNWGLKPQSIGSMEDLVGKLASKTGSLNRIRVISHAGKANIYIKFFANSSNGIHEEQLRGFSENAGEGLASHLSDPLIDDASIDAVVNQLRTSNPKLLKPFGIEKARSSPSALVQKFLLRSIEHWMFTTAGPDSTLKKDEKKKSKSQSAVIATSLRTILDQIILDLQVPAPDGPGIAAADISSLGAALSATASRLMTVSTGLQDDQLIKDLSAANKAATPAFYAKLAKARSRFTDASTIDLRGCRVGSNKGYMQAVGSFFGTNGKDPDVTGPDWWQTFPMLGYDTINDKDIATKAADSDVVASMDHWFSVLGIKGTFADDEARLTHFLNLPMVLPVQLNSNSPGSYKFLALASKKKAAMSAWLGSVWSKDAPGLKAMEKAGITKQKTRRVEAVVDKDPSGSVSEMFVSPDSRYAAHIKTT